MIEEEIIRSIVINGVANSTASFISDQTDVDLKQERLNELLMEINIAIEFAKAHESILHSSLRAWLDDLREASKEGAEVQIAFREQCEDTQSINPWKVAVRLYQRSRRINRLNAAVTRLERKASYCEKFRQMLRDEINKQRDQTYIERVEKLERKVARLRNSLKTIRSNGMLMKRKKTKHAHGRRTTDDGLNILISQPQFADQNHAEPEKKEDPTSEQEIQSNNKETKKAAEATPIQMPAEPVRTPGRNAYRNDTSFVSEGSRRHTVPKFGEWGHVNSSPAGGYNMQFDKLRERKGDGKATPIQIPAVPVRTPPPERNADRNDNWFLSRLLACMSLNTRN